MIFDETRVLRHRVVIDDVLNQLVDIEIDGAVVRPAEWALEGGG